MNTYTQTHTYLQINDAVAISSQHFPRTTGPHIQIIHHK